GIQPPFKIERFGENPPRSTNSSTTRRAIDGWLSSCIDSHTECQTLLDSGKSFSGPTRILEILEDQNAVVLRENVTKMRYACLSHCWGSPEEVCQTRKENVQDHKDKMPFHALTVTFQDAVEICRLLDIRYIWIDSLCIIQDSPEDWGSEASRMADIYENAYITIAATKSAASSGGCYSETSDKYIARAIHGYKNAFSRFKLPGLPTHWSHFGRQKELPLFNRGWIYQEMRLSHRVLHFCGQEVIWDCRSVTLRRNESGSNEHRPPPPPPPPSQGISSTVICHIEFLHKDQIYSGITDEDRMAALAGIVKRIQNHHRMGKYLIGLWEESLIMDLCWARGRESSLDSRRKLRYPSWSWASMHTQVMWGDDVDQAYVPLSTIEGINVVYDGPDNLGKASKSSMSSITIKAPILKCKVVYASDAEVKPQVVLTEAEGIIAWGYNPDFSMPRTRSRTGYVVVLCGKATGTCMALHVQKRRKRRVDVFERVGHVSLLKGSFKENENVLPQRHEKEEFWSILPKPSMMELV
ncbi:tol protein, partial [Colletotrichum asianum]